VTENQRSGAASAYRYRLKIGYHGDESCAGWGGGAWFELEFDTRQEWLQAVEKACGMISELLDVSKLGVIGTALDICYQREQRDPSRGLMVDLFVPVDRWHLEQAFGAFQPHPTVKP